MHPKPARYGKREHRVRGRRGQALRRRRLDTASWCCQDCEAAGKVEAATVVDHIVPLALGGADEDANCRALCDECHRKRTAEQFGRRHRPAISADGWPVG